MYMYRLTSFLLFPWRSMGTRCRTMFTPQWSVPAKNRPNLTVTFKQCRGHRYCRRGAGSEHRYTKYDAISGRDASSRFNRLIQLWTSGERSIRTEAEPVELHPQEMDRIIQLWTSGAGAHRLALAWLFGYNPARHESGQQHECIPTPHGGTVCSGRPRACTFSPCLDPASQRRCRAAM
jgi:hypothetical protein